MPNTPIQRSMSSVSAENAVDINKSIFEIMLEITNSSEFPKSKVDSADITNTPDVVLLADGRKRASIIELPIKLIEHFQDGLDNVLSELFSPTYVVVTKTPRGKDISFVELYHDTPRAILLAKTLREQLESIKQELYKIRTVMFSGNEDDELSSFDEQTPAAASGFVPEIFESLIKSYNKYSTGVSIGFYAWRSYRESTLQKKLGELSSTVEELSFLASKDKHLNALSQLLLKYSAPFKSIITFLSGQVNLTATIANAEKKLLSSPSSVNSTGPAISTSAITVETKLKDLRLLYFNQFLSLNNALSLLYYFKQAKAIQDELQNDLEAITDATKKEQVNALVSSYVEAMRSQLIMYSPQEAIMNAGGNLLGHLNLNQDFFASYGLQLHEIYTDIADAMPELLVEDNGFFSSLRTMSSALKFPMNKIAALPHKELHTQLLHVKTELEKYSEALRFSAVFKIFDPDRLQFLLSIDALTFQTGVAIGPFYPEHFSDERAIEMAKVQAEATYRCRTLVKDALTEDMMNVLRCKVDDLEPQQLDAIIQLERDLLPYIDTRSKLYEWIKDRIMIAYTNKNTPKRRFARATTTLISSLQTVISFVTSQNTAKEKLLTESTTPSSSNELTIDQVLALYLKKTPREHQTIERLKKFSENETKANAYYATALTECDEAFIESRKKQLDTIYCNGRTTLQVTPLSELCDLLAKAIQEASADPVEMFMDTNGSPEMRVLKFRIFDSESAWIVRLKMAHNTLLELDCLIGRYNVGIIDWKNLLISAWKIKHQLQTLAEEFNTVCDSLMPWKVFGGSKDEHVSRVIDVSKDILTLFVPVDASISISPDAPIDNGVLALRRQQSQEQLQKDINTIIVSLPNELVNDAKGGFVVYKNMVKSLFVEIDKILSMDDRGAIATAGIALLNHESFGKLMDLISKMDAIRNNSKINAILHKYISAVKTKIEMQLSRIGQYEQENGLKIGYLTSKAMQHIPNVRDFFMSGHGLLFDELNVFLIQYGNNQKAQDVAEQLKQMCDSKENISADDLAAKAKTIAELSENGIPLDDAKYFLSVLEQRQSIPSKHQKVSIHQSLLCEKQRGVATQQLSAGLLAIISDKKHAAQVALDHIEAGLSTNNDQIKAFQLDNTADVTCYDRPTMVRYSNLCNERDNKVAEKSAQGVSLFYYQKLFEIFNSNTYPKVSYLDEIKTDFHHRMQYIDDIKVIIKQLELLKWNTYYYHRDCFNNHHDYFDSVLIEIKKIQENSNDASVICNAFEHLNALQIKLVAIPEMQHLYRAVQITCHQIRQHINKIIPDDIAKQPRAAVLELASLQQESLSLKSTSLDGKDNAIRASLLRDVNQKYCHAQPNSTEHACYQAAEEFLERWDINEDERGQRILMAMQNRETKAGKRENKPSPTYINDLDDLNVFYKMTAPNGVCLHRSIFSEKNIANKIVIRNLFKRLVTKHTPANRGLQKLVERISSESEQIKKSMAEDNPFEDKINYLKQKVKAGSGQNNYYSILELINLLDKNDQKKAVDELLAQVSQNKTSEQRMKNAFDKFNIISVKKGLPALTPEQWIYLSQKAQKSGDYFWGNNKKGKAELLIQALESGDYESVRLIASIHTNAISRFFKNSTTGSTCFTVRETKQPPEP